MLQLSELRQKCQDDIVAIAHDDDLQVIEGVVSQSLNQYAVLYRQRQPVTRTLRMT
jgi:hypothetical protein